MQSNLAKGGLLKMTKNKCNIVIDSCCDLPYDIVESMGVKKLYFPFEMSGGRHFDDFGQTMTNEEFYKHMVDGECPKTAQIPIVNLTDAFEEIAQSGVPTVFLCFSSGLSGTFDTVLTVSEDTKKKYPDSEIYVVDTKLASIAEGFLVLEAVKQRDNGLTAAELAAWAEEARYFVHGYFTVDSLEWLRKGGRIPPIAAAAGSKLDIKPILTFDLNGHLTIDSLVRGRKKSLKAVAKLLNDNIIEPGKAQIVFGNSVSERDMKALEGMYNGEESIFVECEIGPVIGSHVGPGMVAVSCWGPDRRRQVSFGDRIAKSVRGGSGRPDDAPSMPPFADKPRTE